MATTRPFAYNPSQSPISGTDQLDDLAIGVGNQDYSINPGGVQWWMGPDEDTGYVVCVTVPTDGQPTPISGDTASVGFFKSTALTEESFVSLVNGEFYQNFTTGNDAKAWLNGQGYWTSYATSNVPALIMNWDIQSSSYTGGTTVYDTTGDSNGTLHGTIGYNSGLINYLTITGTSSNWIQSITNLNSFLIPPPTGTQISVFTWVYPTKNAGVILSEQGNSTPDGGWYDSQMELVSGTLKFRVWDSAGISSSAATPINNWYYMGFTYDGTTLRGYVNGNLVATQNVNRQTPGANGNPLYYNLGYPTNTNMGSNQGNNFRFGALSVYNYGLSGAQVLTNYNNTKGQYQVDAVSILNATSSASYPGAGSTWYDLSGKGNNGTLVNTTYSAISGGTMVFNGTNANVAISQPIQTGSDYSISAWVYANNVSAAHNIVSSFNSPFWVNSGTLYAGVGGSYQLVQSSSFPTNQWKFVSMTFNDTTNTMKLYINGALVDTNTSVTQTYTAENTYIGSHFNGAAVSFWNGYIPQVYIYKSEQTATDVQNLFNKTKSTYGL